MLVEGSFVCDDNQKEMINEIIKDVFECEVPRTYSIFTDVSLKASVSDLRGLISHKLQSKNTNEINDTDGRIGPQSVRMYRHKRVLIEPIESPDGLHLTSKSSFASMRTNSCVFEGKWMFEVTLDTAGVQQIGWATLSCPFTERLGVGDSVDSYAYDGKRQKKWNISYNEYGEVCFFYFLSISLLFGFLMLFSF